MDLNMQQNMRPLEGPFPLLHPSTQVFSLFRFRHYFCPPQVATKQASLKQLWFKRWLSDLASALSLSRCFELIYMRWAMSSMAHSLKKSPTFIMVRISKLKERGCSYVSTQRIKTQALLTGWFLTSHSSKPLRWWCSIWADFSFPPFLTQRRVNKQKSSMELQPQFIDRLWR